ncbi:MAG: RidA family protein [Bacteroidetes bacterium]|nr:MAG: RidA family protein [Bacteroidota bacterium]
MKSSLENKLRELGLNLPQISTPGGSYTSVNVRGTIAYVAIQFPIWNEEYRFQGIIGDTITTEQATEAMQLCALNVVAQVEAKIGFENIEGLNHLDAYYRGTDQWDEAPKMVNGASDLFVKVLADKGLHSRAIFGVKDLPREFCVGLTTSWTLLSK